MKKSDEHSVVLVHDKLYASKAAMVFFGIDMSFLTTVMSTDDGHDTGLAGIGSVVGDAEVLVWGGPKVDHTKLRERARICVESHEELHHGDQPPESQERWNSIQQTRSPW